jgi:hypothetical protein
MRSILDPGIAHHGSQRHFAKLHSALVRPVLAINEKSNSAIKSANSAKRIWLAL